MSSLIITAKNGGRLEFPNAKIVRLNQRMKPTPTLHRNKLRKRNKRLQKRRMKMLLETAARQAGKHRLDNSWHRFFCHSYVNALPTFYPVYIS